MSYRLLPDISSISVIVIKVGTSLLFDDSHEIRKEWIISLASDIADLHASGKKILVVSSGAVAMGRDFLRGKDSCNNIKTKQAAAACGQISLVELWRDVLACNNINVAQILLTIEDSENRKRYLNARSTLEILLDSNIIPIINENDTVATSEIKVGDNDRLAARVSQIVSADGLIMLSDVDGLYDKAPENNPDAKLIERVDDIDDTIRKMAGNSGSSFGTGGMHTKLDAAEIASRSGCHMVIASGLLNHPLKRIMEDNKGTWFIAKSNPASARKIWISGSLERKGNVVLDDGACKALKNGNSLLPAGILALNGEFEQGDSIGIMDENSNIIAVGLAAYSSKDAANIIGKTSSEIEKILGFYLGDALVHRDDMVLMK